MVSLQYSIGKKPYLSLGNHGNLIFSSLTFNKKKGYKYMAYNKRYIDHVVIKKASGERNTFELDAFESYVFDMHFKRKEDGSQGVPNGTIPRKIVNELNKIIGSLLIENIYLPFDSLKLLGIMVGDFDWEKLMEKKVKKRKRRKKKFK